MVKKCTSCGKEALLKYVEFKCPGCGKKEIVRCESCKELSVKYTCPECGFKGP